LLFEDKNNFFEAFTDDEKKILRKRVVGMILATDMADHMSHINVLDSKIQHKNISKERNNGHLIIDETDDASKFQS